MDVHWPLWYFGHSRQQLSVKHCHSRAASALLMSDMTLDGQQTEHSPSAVFLQFFCDM